MNVIGFDDGPFVREHRGDVLLVGVVCSGTRVDGIVSGRIRRDGANAAQEMVRLVRASQFGAHLQCVMLQGIAVGGFNGGNGASDVGRTVDATVRGDTAYSRSLGLPILLIVLGAPFLALPWLAWRARRRGRAPDAPAAVPAAPA